MKQQNRKKIAPSLNEKIFAVLTDLSDDVPVYKPTVAGKFFSTASA